MKHAVTAAALCALACTGFAGPAHAQAQGLKLQRSLGDPSAARREDVPPFISADRIEGLGDAEIEAVGDAELRHADTRLTADRIRYFADTDEVEANEVDVPAGPAGVGQPHIVFASGRCGGGSCRRPGGDLGRDHSAW